MCLVARSRYSEKLSTLGLEEKADPYAFSNRKIIVDDMSCWPNSEYSIIVRYESDDVDQVFGPFC